MKYTLFFFVALALQIPVANAQNLVTNPSFEDVITCPLSYSQLKYSRYWYPVTQGTPDYFHACANAHSFPIVAVPANDMGYQECYDFSYAGIFGGAPGSVQDYKEYMGHDIPALEVGATYRVSISIALSNNYSCPTGGMGVYFYVNAKPDTTISTPILYTPQIDYTSYGMITDTLNWVTLSKTFVADSAYTHLVVGNFKPKTAIEVGSGPQCNTFKESYYYVDSVAVEKVTIAGLPSRQRTVNVAVYPNPFTEQTTFAIEGAPGDKRCLYVYNIEGAIVYQQESLAWNINMRREGLSKGLYYYKVISGEGIAAYGKLMIQ